MTGHFFGPRGSISSTVISIETPAKGGCQWGKKVVPHYCNSDLPLADAFSAATEAAAPCRRSRESLDMALEVDE